MSEEVRTESRSGAGPSRCGERVTGRSVGPQEEPWLTPSCLGGARPISTVQRGGRSVATRAITC